MVTGDCSGVKMQVQPKVVDIEKVLCFQLTEDGQKKQSVDTPPSWLAQ